MEVPGTACKRQKRTRALCVAKAREVLWLLGVIVAQGLGLSLLSACNLDNPGVNPPRGVLSYPIALALGDADEEGKVDVLYVANSNFDLRYNAGSVHAYDLGRINARINKEGCGLLGVDTLPPEGGYLPFDAGLPRLPDASQVDASASDAAVDGGADASVDGGADGSDAGVDAGLLETDVAVPSKFDDAAKHGTLRGILCDGRDPDGHDKCCFEDSREFLRKNGEVLIDSYATGLALSPAIDEDEKRRLYVPLRARSTLLYLDIEADGSLSCDNDDGVCTRGTDRSDPDFDPDQSFPFEPRALTVGSMNGLVEGGASDDAYVLTVHDSGQLALLVDEGDGPKLHSVVSGLSFGSAVRVHPTERLIYTTSANAATPNSSALFRWGVESAERTIQDDAERDAQDKRWLLYSSSSVGLTVAGGFDIRDLALDADNPNRLIALMRGEVESVLFVERDPSSVSEGFVSGAVRVGAGPSKLTQAVLGNRKLLFVSCFDARAIFVIDQTRRQLVSVIRGLAGPFDMKVDTARNRLYVADFRANVLRVVDVQGLVDARLPPPRIIATLGKPSFGENL